MTRRLDPEDCGWISPETVSDLACRSVGCKREMRNKHHGGEFFSIIVSAKGREQVVNSP